MPYAKRLKTLTTLIRRKEFYYLYSPGARSHPVYNHATHARAAVDWLLLANRVCNGNGFSKLYSLRGRWLGPYVETTGYIIPTLQQFMSRDDYRREEISRAVRSSGEWLLRQQYAEGAFGDSISPDPSRYRTSQAMVFDTGQVIFGLLAMYRSGNDGKYLAAAARAGDWLVSMQHGDGSWVLHTYNENPQTYYSRVAHALAELWNVTREDKYRLAAQRKLEWVVEQQAPNGAFRNCSFHSEPSSVLHVIAYTIDGLWKAGQILNDERFRKSAHKAARSLVEIQMRDRVLSGHYTVDWLPANSARCMTGLAQMAEIWILMYKDAGEKDFLSAARVAIEYLKRIQIMEPKQPNLYGGLFGSYPWGGSYFPWAIPNWGQKFFLDAMHLDIAIGEGG